MIKFWKSAAKGKSGCPVRPPEVNDENLKPFSLETISEDEELHSHLQKSRLSLSLRDILSDKNTSTYLIEYLNNVGKVHLIKCWLELEEFKNIIYNTKVTAVENNEKSIPRTQSFHLKNTDDRFNSGCSKLKRHSWSLQCDEYKNDFNKSYSNTPHKSNENRGHCMQDGCADCENKNFTRNVVNEAINLFKKYIAQEATYKLDLPDNIRKNVISNICEPEGDIKTSCFQSVQDILFEQLEKKYYDGFKKSPLYVKAQIDILTNGSLNLEDIIYNECILFYFTEYLDQENCRVLLEFIMAITHFLQNLLNFSKSNTEQVETDAIILYDKYFSLQAISPIGFSTDVRLKVEANICKENGPDSDCFEFPYQIVYKTLSNYVKTFQKSELYYKYLSEMINSVDELWQSHKKSQSDCSSEFSINKQNTLLAMGDPAFHRKKRNHSVPDMTIDSNQLYNADLLWQRKKQEGLSLGRVNSLGRFESKFEPDPDKKEKSVLKKMVNRFVPGSSSKVEEEMAWQVAHMIIKDITDLTMAPPDNDTS